MNSKKYHVLLLFITIILLIFDQLIKFQTRVNIKLGQEIKIIPKILSFTYLQNTGAAWSFMEGNSIFFLLVAIFAILVFIYLLYKCRNEYFISLGIALMLTGTVGNLIDRIKFGFVTDMIKIDFINFPIFNVADMCLTFGVIILLFSLLKEE
ncbi:signal peptidase II [Fructilactobacillus sanfranciscensis]|uniref:Lipoprotein signal peptidase n=1 Tax=Fructilactobacillus sanfranciscensis TaxID=1625 RepID=A0A5C4TJD6_FRUSA|nr:signal peptidase II [Fructilactobacillus sanfranciscensis]TNK90041.1 signal peptidase II [Fructilactobacillus sanfranciscensis]TNK97141.1 signal peptidase II [Fructilactobacillus sanfranciscensis]TNK98980.1 signal peptidase II [Fructilactobacillus sanfranciscensis]TNL00764.1 signal peptidase II [Fructilactobacillus sanfranciscensis]WED56845.1 signal peptidase II [Fructilactobacillus sanfranciscensis]